MTEERQSKEIQSSYRSIFKATSLFGGVQVYTILIQIIKSKIIALLLGPLGVGVQGLYQSAIDLIKHGTSFGLSQSAVRDVAEANGSNDMEKISIKVVALRKIVWGTGLLGMFALILFAPLLSKISFGNNKYTLSFICLAIILLFEQLISGQKVVLQGTRRLKDLAKVSAIGAIISLVVSIPVYYIWKVDGIVPAMILTAFISLVVSWCYSRKVYIAKKKLSIVDVIAEGKTMMVMGISMSLSGVMAMAAGYIVRSYIRNIGGIDEVGLFQAGFVIINSYVGLIFNAIATDYYPRLASVNFDNEKCSEVVSKQGEISFLLMAPLMTICIIAMPFVITILYSKQFLAADQYIKWACLGMMFRLASWLVSYIFIAKAESKLFVANETIANLNFLWMSILGYKNAGLTGLGIAFTINYFVYFCQVFYMSKYFYNFVFSKSFIKIFVIQLILVTLCLVFMIKLNAPYNYIGGIICTFLSLAFALNGLINRLDLKSIIKNGYRNK